MTSRFLPKSLLGQVMLALAAALLIAQAVSAALLYRAAEQRRELGLVHAAAFQLLAGTRRADLHRDRLEEDANGQPDGFGPGRETRRDGGRLPRRLRFNISEKAPIEANEPRDRAREAVLAQMLGHHGITVEEIRIATRPLLADETVRAAMREMPHMRISHLPIPSQVLVVGLRREGDPRWLVARVPMPMRDRNLLGTLALQTVLIFAVLCALLYIVLRRMTRPLHALAERTRSFGNGSDPRSPLEPTGPEDVSRLIAAHNAMEARIGAMLDEKDVMLGAIGHDLKTPLAALRVRVEGIADETARARMVDSIEEITRTLDEILSLARVGRESAAPERTDLAALAASVVEEFEDMGHAVEIDTLERIAAPVHLTWLKRGLRNLVSNAVRYGGSAQVSVLREGASAVLRVDDRGPGIPEGRLADMLEPFTRGEESRNRETGGAGLGLTLARAVAEQHGGLLVLANRREGGLRAEIRLPL